VLGLLAGWFGLVRKSLLEGIRKRLSKKGDAILRSNEKAFAAGLDYAEKNPLKVDKVLSPPVRSLERKLLTDGNENVRRGRDFRRLPVF